MRQEYKYAFPAPDASIMQTWAALLVDRGWAVEIYKDRASSSQPGGIVTIPGGQRFEIAMTNDDAHNDVVVWLFPLCPDTPQWFPAAVRQLVQHLNLGFVDAAQRDDIMSER